MVLAEARNLDASSPVEAVCDMKQNLGVLGDLQFFNEGPGPSPDLGVGRLAAVGSG